MRLGGKMKR